MRGLFRYAFLKSSRDGSLITLLFAPSVMLVCPLLVGWLFARNLKLIQPPAHVFAALVQMMSGFTAALAAFLAFRGEIANRAIGSFVLATRSWQIPLASTLYGAVVGVVGALGATAFGMTIWTFPSDPSTFFSRVLLVSLAAASAGALAIVVSQSMAAAGWVFVGMMVLIVIFDEIETTPIQQMSLAVLIIVISVSLAAFFLERRCAA